MAVFAGLVLISTGYFATLPNTSVSAAPSSTLTFQARILTAPGALIPDGNYNVQFNLYDVASGGTSLWAESYLNQVAGNDIVVKNGYLYANLGTITSFPSTINFDQELWLTLNLGNTNVSCTPFTSCAPDGEMTPRFKITATPYAFKANSANNVNSNNQTAASTNSGNIQIQSGNATGATSNSGNISIDSGTATGTTGTISLGSTNASGLNLGRNGLTTQNLGNLTVQGGTTTLGTSGQIGGLVVNDGNGQTTTIRAGDSTGNITFVLPASIGNANDCLRNGATPGTLEFAACGAVTPFVNKTKTVDESVNNSGVPPTQNTGAALQDDDQLFFDIGANETWNFRFLIQANVPAAPDMRAAVSAPAGATCRVGVYDVDAAVTYGILGCGVSSAILTGNTADDVYEVEGSVTNGATAGRVTLRWAQFTANAASTIVRSGSYVEASRTLGGSSADVAYIQGGNSFGSTATIGTNDNNALSILTSSVERIRVLATGETQFTDDIIAKGAINGATGTTTGTGTNTTTLTLTTDPFNVNDVVRIDNAGQDFYTRVTVDGGTGTYTVSPAVTFETGRTVSRYAVQNIGATSTDYASEANRFFQGYFLGGVVIGTGSTTIGDGTINSTTTLRLQTTGGDVEFGGNLTISGAITGDASGLTNISGGSVDGATITGLNASNIGSGTLADARLSSSVTLLGNSFNGNDQLLQLNSSGGIPALSGTLITGLNASNIGSGTLADARLSSSVTLLGNTFNGADQLLRLNGTGQLPALSGILLTNLNATNVATGTLADGRLSSNVTIQGNVFNGNNQLLQLNGTGGIPAVSGSLVTGLSASNISTGTLADARLSSSVTLLGNTFNGNDQLLQLNSSGGIPAISGALVTTLNASNISSGTLADARLSSSVTLLGNTFNGADQLLRLNGSGQLPALSGILLTNLNASNVASGTLADGRLTTNVGLLTGSQTFSGLKTFSAGITITTGQTLTLNGDGLTDLTGSGLVLGGSSLAVDATSATAFIRNGGNTLGGLVTIGANDANDISFVTTALDRLRIRANGNIGINNQTPDNKLSINTPTTVVPSTEVVISTGVAASKGLVIQGVASQSGNLLEAQTSAGSIIAGIDSTGRLLLGRSSGATGAIVMNNSTNANTTTFVSGVATGARTITLPDESGTVCLSNSNNCGYIRIAAGSVQTDASNNDVISINKTSATGNLISIQRSGTAAFTVANSGALQIRATSTTGLDIQTGAGVSTFSVDTSGNVVRVGSAIADATAVQLVLDTKNTTGDPTGVNGGQYYNSADGKFRCFENGLWTDCMSMRVVGETTLAAASSTINVTIPASFEYLECRVDIKGRSVNNGVYLRFNNDNGVASYGWNEYDIIGTAVGDAQDSSDSEIQLTGTDTTNITASSTLRITNFADTQKIVDWSYSGASAIGINNRRYSGTGNWSNVVDPISSVQFLTSAGTFNAGSHAWCQGRNVR